MRIAYARGRGSQGKRRRRPTTATLKPAAPDFDRHLSRLIGRTFDQHDVHSVLALQRKAGNAALVRLLNGPRQARRDVAVQRDRPADDAAAAKAAAARKKADEAKAKAEDAKALKAMKAAFTYPFWLLSEGKGLRPGSADDASVMLDGVAVRFLPDRFLTEDEFAAAGGTFHGEHGSAGAVTNWAYDGLDFDPKSVKTEDFGGQPVVADYREPIAKVRIQTTYRKTRSLKTLDAARRQRSGYGKGTLLQDHEASHQADAIAYLRANGPRLPTLVGSPLADFHTQLSAYYTAAKNIGTDIAAYSRGKTDCPGAHNATFCPVAKPAAKVKR